MKKKKPKVETPIKTLTQEEIKKLSHQEWSELTTREMLRNLNNPKNIGKTI